MSSQWIKILVSRIHVQVHIIITMSYVHVQYVPDASYMYFIHSTLVYLVLNSH